MSDVFKHGGDLGDLIYCLPVMRAAAGGEPFGLLLGKPGRKVRKPWTPEWAANAIPLLQLQPYIAWVRLHDGVEPYTVDCDGFRERIFTKHIRGKPIPLYLCDELGVDPACLNEPWITVDEPWHVEGLPVVVSRSLRYHNRHFPWRQSIRLYQGRMVFIGTEEEHDHFSMQHLLSIPYLKTENLLEVARVIAGSRLFVGNQSACNAVAEGLKVDILQESWSFDPNCRYDRPGFHRSPPTLKELSYAN